jgi:hypothetical protein
VHAEYAIREFRTSLRIPSILHVSAEMLAILERVRALADR